MIFKYEFRPYPFYGLVFVELANELWYHLDRNKYRFKKNMWLSLYTIKYENYRQISLILFTFRLSYARLNKS